MPSIRVCVSLNASITAGVHSRCHKYARCGKRPDIFDVERLHPLKAIAATHKSVAAFMIVVFHSQNVRSNVRYRIASLTRSGARWLQPNRDRQLCVALALFRD